MRRTEIYRQVLSGSPVLTIPSRFPPLPAWQKVLVYAVFYGCAILFAFPSFAMGMPWWFWMLGVLLGTGIVFLGHYIVAEGEARKVGMVVTDVGISIGPYRSALWHEITAWNFRAYSGLLRVSFSRAGEGVSLSLFFGELKFSQGPFSVGRGGSAFAEQGFYFDENQQALLQKIFAEHNIPRWQ